MLGAYLWVRQKVTPFPLSLKEDIIMDLKVSSVFPHGTVGSSLIQRFRNAYCVFRSAPLGISGSYP